MTARLLDDCGCCEGIAGYTPAEVWNRPGLSAIAYRVGTHSLFKKSMLAGLSGEAVPALAHLRTRDDDDFSIALIDAWATVADVLTFYQERIARENYLRTAAERRSVLELGQLIGYRPASGVAAETHLAFTLEEAPGAAQQAVQQTTIPTGTKAQSVPKPGEKAQIYETVETIEARVGWNAMKPRPVPRFPRFRDTEVYLKGQATGLSPGDPLLIVGRELWRPFPDMSSEQWEIRRVSAVTLLPGEGPGQERTLVQWEEPLGSRLPLVVSPEHEPRVYALRVRASLFGHNAPDWKSLPDALTGSGKVYEFRKEDWAEAKLKEPRIWLDAVYPGIIPDTWAVLATPTHAELWHVHRVTAEAVADFALVGKCTRLEMTGEHIEKFDRRTTTVYAQSEQLDLAEAPAGEPVTGSRVVLDHQVEGLTKGRQLIVSGRISADETVAEVVTLAQTPRVVEKRTVLDFEEGLKNIYRRETVVIHGNVARATHGETVREVLGSGDGAQAYQSFELRQKPLTYVASDAASGADSTLKVYVNEVQWHEAPALFGREREERIFSTRTDAEGTTTVQFGDGTAGARPPTGSCNVRAEYRKGIGVEGNAGPVQITQLVSRPLGVKGVANPLAATGGDDPARLEDARRNAPLTVLTLDRVVSLQDYEDFARARNGVSKALATWTWDGHRLGVFLTLAGPGGAPVAPSETLLKALRGAGRTHVPLRVESYRGRTFRVDAGLRVRPDFASRVIRDAEEALRSRFSFEARSFGQPVMLSEVIAVLQDVEGVLGVDVNKLHYSDTPAGARPPTRLAAWRPLGGEITPAPAELLTLDPGAIDLRVLS